VIQYLHIQKNYSLAQRLVFLFIYSSFNCFKAEKEAKNPDEGGRYLKNLLIIAAVFCLPLATPDSVTANIHPEYRHGSNQVKKSKPLKVVRGWMTYYYGPLPGQSRYKHGSYKKEINNCGKGEETATGTRPTKGRTISVNFEIFPKGSVLRITNTKTGKSFIGVAEDTGQTMQAHLDGSWIDNFAGHGEGALIATEEGGKQPVLIELIKKPKKDWKKSLLAAR
jgi:3D (Asp-Asp-Asp) domain-containing protein